MNRLIADIRFFPASESGRKGDIPAIRYGCPVFFESVEALSSHGYDCRILFDELGRGAFFGETVHAVPMIFLSPDEVFHHVRVGTTFRLWEGGFIAQGVVVGILPSSSATTVVHNNEYEE